MEKLNDELDPLTLTRTLSVEEEGKLHIRTEADISANLEYATALRNNDQYSADGIKKGFFHAAHVPATVVVELMKNGVNIYRASAKEIVAGLRRIGKDHLITTRKRV